MHSLTPSIVRILSERNQVFGAGFLVSERHVITSANVIIYALGILSNIQSIPDQQVHLDFVAVPRALLMARVTHWYPTDKEDIAVLELEVDPPDGTQPARLLLSNNFWGHKFQAFGFPRGFDDGIWISGELQEVVESTRLVQMESSREGAFVGGGFGGAPVWDMQLSGVIGMCYSHENRPKSKLAFMKSISSVIEVWPELNKYVVQADKPSEDSKYETHFVGPISGQVSSGSGDITIRIARDALISSEISGPVRTGVDAEGNVVVVESVTPKVVTKLPQEAAYERIATTADSTRKQIEQIYEQGRRQAEQWSRFSLAAAILGFLIVVGGGIAILIGNTPAGLVTSAAGIIPEVAAALFFQQAREANKRVDDIREKLLEAEGIHRAIELSLTTDEETQNRLKEAIIMRILGLSAKGQEVRVSTSAQQTGESRTMVPPQER